MRLGDMPIVDPRPLLIEERADLLALLRDLSDTEWVAPTESGHWRVKDVALHLLDDDLGWLSRGRDGDPSGLLSTDCDYRDSVASLDAKNELWVIGASGLSHRLVTDLLEWSGKQVDDHYAGFDLTDPSRVIWAADDAVPIWFDLCRDLTERWIHQQHIRDAIGRPGNHVRFLGAVLRTFVWAFPHQFDAAADDGTTVGIGLGAGGAWTLTRRAGSWELASGVATNPAASFEMHETVAWRQLTGLPVPRDRVKTSGPGGLVDALLAVRGIIV